MAWDLLRTDYKDAVWDGMKKYVMIHNTDNTVSMQDVTAYAVFDAAFFGAEDANRINTAVNAIMAALENGTDLYEVFSNFFEEQKELFKNSADTDLEAFAKYIEDLEADADQIIAQIQLDYKAEISSFEKLQEAIFDNWFSYMKGQLSRDPAGNLQLEIDDLSKKVFNHYTGLVSSDSEFLPDGSIITTNEEATITTVFGKDENGNKQITEVIEPVNTTLDPYKYRKITTIYKATPTSNKRIVERYTRYMTDYDETEVILAFGDSANKASAQIDGKEYPVSNLSENEADMNEVTYSYEIK